MRSRSVFRDLFGLSGRLGVGDFLAILLLDCGILIATIIAGAALWRRLPSGPGHALAGTLILGVFPLAGWMLLSLLVRIIRNISFVFWCRRNGFVSREKAEISFGIARATSKIQPLSEAHENDEFRVFRAGRRVRWEILIISAILTFPGVFMIRHPEHQHDIIAGYICIVLFGFGGIFYAFKTIFGRPELRLDANGFSIVHFGRVKKLLWLDIDKPFRISVYSFTKRLSYSVRTQGMRLGLTDIYDIKLEDLAILMNEYRERARSIVEK